MVVNRRLIADESDARAAQQIKPLVEQLFQSENRSYPSSQTHPAKLQPLLHEKFSRPNFFFHFSNKRLVWFRRIAQGLILFQFLTRTIQAQTTFVEKLSRHRTVFAKEAEQEMFGPDM